jgi:ABC-type nickel/cobalt efflux system permease component RcnA
MNASAPSAAAGTAFARTMGGALINASLSKKWLQRTAAILIVRLAGVLSVRTPASASKFVGTKNDQNKSNRVEHPARMATARCPKVSESAVQVEAANEQAGR